MHRAEGDRAPSRRVRTYLFREMLNSALLQIRAATTLRIL
jgi:hypothetical protein